MVFPLISASTFVNMFSPIVQHQGNAKCHSSDWIIHQPRMLIFRISNNNNTSVYCRLDPAQPEVFV